MPFLLPLIAFLLAVFAEFVFRDPGRIVTKPAVGRIAAAFVLGVVAMVVSNRYAPKAQTSPLEIGLWVGAVFGVGASFRLGRPGPTFLLAPLGVGAAVAACVHFFPVPDQPAVGEGLIVGLGIVALCLCSESASATALVGTVLVAADYLCARHSSSPAAAYLGSLAGLLAVVGGLVVPWLGSRLAVLSGIIVGAVTLGGVVIASSSVSDRYLSTTLAIGLGAAIVIGWLIGDEAPDATRVGLAAAIGIGVATVTFGLSRGAGMSLALVGAVGVLLAQGLPRPILTLGPLFGLVLFRLLAEAHPGASHALDIGQHYALLGLLLGAVVPLLPSDWSARARGRDWAKWKDSAGAALWGALPLGVPPLVYLMFGDKGAIGFVVGLGFSGICQVLRRESDLLPTALAGAMAVVTVLSMNWMSAGSDISRDSKVRIFEVSGGALAIVAAFLALLAWERPHSGKPVAEVAK